MKPTLLLAAAMAAASALIIRQSHVQSLCELYGYWSNNDYELLNNLGTSSPNFPTYTPFLCFHHMYSRSQSLQGAEPAS